VKKNTNDDVRRPASIFGCVSSTAAAGHSLRPPSARQLRRWRIRGVHCTDPNGYEIDVFVVDVEYRCPPNSKSPACGYEPPETPK
jgi:hypothetical protein